MKGIVGCCRTWIGSVISIPYFHSNRGGFDVQCDSSDFCNLDCEIKRRRKRMLLSTNKYWTADLVCCRLSKALNSSQSADSG